VVGRAAGWGRIDEVSQSMPLPAAMVQRARDFTGPPVPARPAATVVLLRPAGEAFEVYVLRRAATMVFGGVYAFPGGGVDRNDVPETIRQDWAQRLGVPEAEAKAVVGAAARELFEEAGVLLAGPSASGPSGRGASGSGVAEHGVADGGTAEGWAGGLVGDVSGADWEADRVAVQRRELSMAELLARRGLRLRDDLLRPWARWITPEFEPKRFDTWFFVAVLPPGQVARDVSGEADRTTWISPADANGLAMLPPTRVMVHGLCAYRDILGVLAAERNAAAPVMPRVELTEDGGVLRL
jgi:8-oxo-dGTP pyrophosphatase MutT (NUDIX family)